MGEFEKCIKELYPKDGERIANKYPDMSYEELYWSEFDVWKFQQSKIEQLEKEKAEMLITIHNKNLSITKQAMQIKEALSLIEQNKRYIPFLAIDMIEKALRGECE